MDPEQQKQLIIAACNHRLRAYAPYSKFLVGAAVLTAGGEIFGGCNVENASFGLTICAERVAFCAAVAAGFQQFAGLAVATTGAHAPCGACRQFAAEFCDDLPVLLINADMPTEVFESRLRQLLPGRFQLPDGQP